MPQDNGHPLSIENLLSNTQGQVQQMIASAIGAAMTDPREIRRLNRTGIGVTTEDDTKVLLIATEDGVRVDIPIHPDVLNSVIAALVAVPGEDDGG